MDERKNGSFHGHDSHLEGLIGRLPGDGESGRAAQIFALLADSTRLKILWLLCHCEECVCDIAAAVGMSAPAVSHHLSMLRRAGLLQGRRVGKEVLYTLSHSPEALFVHDAIDKVLLTGCPSEE